MNKSIRHALAAICGLIASAALATTVIPPTFQEMVGRAQMIFQGTVTNVRSEWSGEGAQRHIVSYVTFQVDDMLKGSPQAQVTLRMMGGTVGDQTMEVSDAPKFKVGDRDILFVENNGTQFIPLVGIMHGRFRVKNDETGREVVTNNEGAPVSDLAQLGHNPRAAVNGRGLSPQEFKQAVRTVAASATAQP